MSHKEAVFARIEALGLVAVLRGSSADLTLRMVEALIAGGVRAIEITFTTPDALSVVQTLAQTYGDEIVLGVGTLVEPEQARAAQEAGARFLVSPHCEAELAKAMRNTGLVTMFGALTPSEIVAALRLGCDAVKLFPGALGGPDYLKALRGPFPAIPIVPTGGVELDNVADWFEAGALAVGAGSALCPTKWAQEGRFGAIAQRAQAFVAAISAARSAKA